MDAALPCKQCTAVLGVLLCVQTVEGEIAHGLPLAEFAAMLDLPRVCCHARLDYSLLPC